MRGRNWLGLALSAALLLTACGGGEPAPTPQPTATPEPVEMTQTPRTEFALPCYAAGGFHPITGTNRTNLTLAPLLYEGLFELDGGFVPQKALCESYSVSEDGLVWTFRLAEREFSDGAPLTPAEVKASLDLARQSDRYAPRLGDVSWIQAGENEVTVYLSRPNGGLPALLDIPIVKETEDPLRPLGTGEYVVAGEGETLRLTAKNGTEVPLRTIPLRSVRASDDLVYAFEAQEISLVDTDLTGTNVLGWSGRFETTDYPTTTLLYVGYNAQTGLCADETLRRALSLAYDREGMVRRLLAGHGEASTLPVHPRWEHYDDEVARALAGGEEEAVALLEQSGWKIEEGQTVRAKRRVGALDLRLLVNQENTYKVRMAEEVAAELEELGCSVTVEKLPWEEFVSALEWGNFDLYLGETALTADFDLSNLLGAGGGLNYGGFYDAETAGLLQRCREAAETERGEAVAALCERVGMTAPMAPLCFKNGSMLTQWGQVDGAVPTQRDLFANFGEWEIKL